MTKRPLWMGRGVLIVSAAMLIGACGGPDPTPTPTRAPTPTPTVPPVPGVTPTATPTVDPFEARWNDLIEKAQAEGNVQILTDDSNVEPILDRFKQLFGIEAVLGTQGGSDSTNRVLAEQQGGRYTVDINNSGSGSSERLSQAGVLKPADDVLFHPEAIDYSQHRFGGPVYIDSFQKYVVSTCFRLARPVGLHYNTNNISPDQLMQSYEDLLDPALKGRVALDDISVDGTTGTRTSVFLLLGPEYLVDLYTLHQENILPHGDGQINAGLARGKFDYTFGGESSDFDAMMNLGLPIGRVELTGAIVADPRCEMGVFEPARNPNAASLFMNWWLSREGQTAMNELRIQRAGRESLSYRLDVPQGGVPDEVWNKVQNAGEFAVDVHDEAYFKARGEASELIQNLFRELGILI